MLREQANTNNHNEKMRILFTFPYKNSLELGTVPIYHESVKVHFALNLYIVLAKRNQMRRKSFAVKMREVNAFATSQTNVSS